MEYDTFGDSYKEELDEITLRKCFIKMDAVSYRTYPINPSFYKRIYCYFSYFNIGYVECRYVGTVTSILALK